MVNREIKFRGRDVKGKWHYGYYWADFDKHFIREKRSDGGWEDFLIIPETVGQFTGHLDRNKKEIYERDIVQGIYKDKKFNDGIVYIYPEFGVVIESKKIGVRINTGEWDKIIGNIYENPELLK